MAIKNTGMDTPRILVPIIKREKNLRGNKAVYIPAGKEMIRMRREEMNTSSSVAGAFESITWRAGFL